MLQITEVCRSYQKKSTNLLGKKRGVESETFDMKRAESGSL